METRGALRFEIDHAHLRMMVNIAGFWKERKREKKTSKREKGTRRGRETKRRVSHYIAAPRFRRKKWGKVLAKGEKGTPTIPSRCSFSG